MHNAVMAEFGDSHADDDTVWQVTGVAVDRDMTAEVTGDDIEFV
jgi:hypothetical protein